MLVNPSPKTKPPGKILQSCSQRDLTCSLTRQSSVLEGERGDGMDKGNANPLHSWGTTIDRVD